MLYYVFVFFVCSKIHLIWLIIWKSWWFVTWGKIVLHLSMTFDQQFCSLLITFSCTFWTLWRSSGYYNVLRRSQNEYTMYCWQNEFLETWHNWDAWRWRKLSVVVVSYNTGSLSKKQTDHLQWLMASCETMKGLITW